MVLRRVKCTGTKTPELSFLWERTAKIQKTEQAEELREGQPRNLYFSRDTDEREL